MIPQKIARKTSLKGELPLVGIGAVLCLLYWFAEGLVESELFQLGPLWERVVWPDAAEITERMVVCALIMALAFASDLISAQRRRFAQRARADEERYQGLLESALEGVWVIDEHEKTIFVNECLADMLGYGVKEMLGLSPLDFIDENSKPLAKENLARRKAGMGESHEVLLISKGGRPVHAHVASSPIVREDGTYAGAMALVTDVTAEREALAALKVSEEKFEKAFQVSPDAVTITRASDGAFLEVNEGFTRLTGYTPQETLARTTGQLDLFADPEDRDRALRTIDEKGSVRDAEIWFRRKDGSLFLGSLSASSLMLGTDRHVLATTRDITEERRASVALRRSEEQYRNVYAEGPLAFVVWDTGCVIRDWNRRAEEIFGWSKTEVAGRNFFEFLVPSDERPTVQQVVDVLIERSLPATSVNRNLTKGGGEILCEWYNAILHDEEGRAEGVISMALDVTARHRAEKQIRDSLEEKEVLLKEVHHRVKNNLQVVSTLLSLQGAQASDTGEREILRESQSRVRSMSLVHERLYGAPNLGQIDFGAYVADLVDQLLRSHGAQDGRVTPVIAIRDVRLSMDTAITCGLIVNELVTNSLKYAFRNGRPGQIRVAMERDTLWSLTVEDDGVGLPPGLDHLTASTLGLMLVTTLVKQLKGEIRLGPVPGTSFTIRFDKT